VGYRVKEQGNRGMRYGTRLKLAVGGERFQQLGRGSREKKREKDREWGL